MQSSLYVALSGQMALLKRLETIAHNVANSSTTGFRAEEVKFDSFISNTPLEPVAYASRGDTYLSRATGEFVKTDNPLDVAVNGDAWLAMQTPSGTVYTRDGRMQMLPTGELQTVNGYPILDVGGSPILLDASAGEPIISQDGTITQGGRRLGAIGLYTIPEEAKLTRFDNSGVIPEGTASPVVEFTRVGLSQGFQERANVNPVMEISKLIQVQRTFDAISASVRDTENSLSDAITKLGETS